MLFWIIAALLLLLSGFAAFTFSLYTLWNLDCDLELKWAEKFANKLDKLKGKVIWLTSAQSGVGEHLAYKLATVGAKLVLSGANKEELKVIAKNCAELGQYDESNILVLPFDITNCAVHQKQLDLILGHFKKLDILVSNADKKQRAKFQESDLEADKELFESNVFSLINLNRRVLDYFLEANRAGQLVVLATTLGLPGVPGSGTYTATKGALDGYFETLRVELAGKGITVTMITRGPVEEKVKNRAGLKGRFSGRMAVDRCAHLLALSLVTRIDQAVICRNPFLLFYYLTTYLPTLTRKVLPTVMTEKRWKQIVGGL